MNKILLSIILLASCFTASGQSDSLARQDEVYNRPFITIGKTSTAVGGYFEGNTNYFSEDGVSEGFSMELRRFNVFLFSSVLDRIKFLSELEFEHGTEEIALETAMLDLEIHSAFNLRGGIILAPIGGFNINHDSPKWEFVERPLISTQIIPSTLSETGFGAYGKLFMRHFTITYDAYLVNGLRDGVILNEEGRTFYQSGKHEEMFGEDNNGTPMLTGRAALRWKRKFEAGLSYYGGVYNSFRRDGVEVDSKRRLSIYAFDYHLDFGFLSITGEAASNFTEVPADISTIYGKEQWGTFTDVIVPFLRRQILSWENTVFSVMTRFEKIDYNKGAFAETGRKIFDEETALSAGISFRPAPDTVFRANYRYHWIRDIIGNPAVHKAGFQFGFASYF
jgi:hypothetical protein